MSLPVFDGGINMGIDARLLAMAERGKLGWRVYGWDGPWVSLGRFQSPQEALVDPEAVPWVVRPTGGLAVLHGHDVTVGLAAPMDELLPGARDPSRPSLRAVYRLAIAPIVVAMRECGVPAVLGEDYWRGDRHESSNKNHETEDIHPPTPFFPTSRGFDASGAELGGASSDCFAAVSPNDIVDANTGLKVCGCALRVTRKAVLVQASIPAGPPIIDPSRIFASPAVIVHQPWDHLVFPSAFESAVSAAFLARSTA